MSDGFLTSFYALDDVARPTFFELVAQEQLVGALRPAAQFVAGILADRVQSTRALALLSRWDLFFRMCMAIVDWIHLTRYGASLSEHFFGLRRLKAMPLRKISPLEKVELERQRLQAPMLTLKQQLASLFVLVIFPWIRHQCEAYFREFEAVPQLRRSMFQRLFLRIYPWVHAASQSSTLAYQMLYLLGRVDVWSPSLQMLSLKVVRDMPPPPDVGGKVGSRKQKLFDALGTLGSTSLMTFIYGMQFAQWWYQREHLLQPYQARKVPPPPPRRVPYSEVALPIRSDDRGKGLSSSVVEKNTGPRLVLLPQDRTICPLCHRVRRNPAMSASGHVFCYPCLVRHVDRIGHCPVTGLRTRPEQVRRIRDDDN